MPEAYSWILMSHLFNKLTSWPHSIGQDLPRTGLVFSPFPSAEQEDSVDRGAHILGSRKGGQVSEDL